MCNSICEGGNFTYIELPYFYGTRCILIFPNNLRKLVLSYIQNTVIIATGF